MFLGSTHWSKCCSWANRDTLLLSLQSATLPLRNQSFSGKERSKKQRNHVATVGISRSFWNHPKSISAMVADISTPRELSVTVQRQDWRLGNRSSCLWSFGAIHWKLDWASAIKVDDHGRGWNFSSWLCSNAQKKASLSARNKQCNLMWTGITLRNTESWLLVGHFTEPPIWQSNWITS